MKNKYSFIAFILVSLILLFYRVNYSDLNSSKPLRVTTWDAFGYYMYLPSFFIYHDATELKWLPGIDKKYKVTGGTLYQAEKLKNGNYVFKYFGGVAIMEFPFFLIGHIIASNTHYAADGFSAPYQYAISFGAVIYCILALFLLRKLLLKYFKDITTALTILLLVSATNLIQYISVDGGMSHAYIFPLYVLVLYTTIKWHEKPRVLYAALTGLIIGLATISRPTELIMFFIPLLWGTNTKEESKKKWGLVKAHRNHVIWALVFGFIGILPQLIYWKYASGSFIFNVGSKWFFLNPYFRVLFGWVNGWFIYTPITIFFILGFFFMKKFPFKNSVITFCLLNIWIIIAWSDWKYGATYSTRALVQSYPVFAFPFAVAIDKIRSRRWGFIFYIIAAYLIFVNLFQIWQYDKTILHYRDMNRQYYSHIYLNSHPRPLDMSLLDTKEFLKDEDDYDKSILISIDSSMDLNVVDNQVIPLTESFLPKDLLVSGKEADWLRIEASIKVQHGTWGSYINCELMAGDSSKLSRIRMFSPLNEDGALNKYDFYMKVPEYFKGSEMKLYISPAGSFSGNLKDLKVIYFRIRS